MLIFNPGLPDLRASLVLLLSVVCLFGPLTLGITFCDFSGEDSFAFILIPPDLDSQTSPPLIFSLDNRNQDELKNLIIHLMRLRTRLLRSAVTTPPVFNKIPANLQLH
jgi:hypothetical protein